MVLLHRLHEAGSRLPATNASRSPPSSTPANGDSSNFSTFDLAGLVTTLVDGEQSTGRPEPMPVDELDDRHRPLQHHYGVKKSDALGALHRLLEDGEIEATGGAGKVLATRRLASAKPGFVDRLIHRAYVTNGGRMATFETASAKLSAVVVLGR